MNDKQLPQNSTFGAIVEERFNRRSLLGGLFKAIPAAALMGSQASAQVSAGLSPEAAADAAAKEATKDVRLTFSPISLSREDAINVPAGYKVGLLVKWGDPVTADAPPFDPNNQTPEAQARQFGYNVDWLDFFPLPAHNVPNPNHGLIAVNHEYTNPELMFRNFSQAAQTKSQADVELNAHGLSVIEVMRDRNGDWNHIPGGLYGRRITAFTPMELTGPAAGSELLRTSVDPTGRRVMGTLNNCSGGKTPWGTVLSGEENFHQYFSNAAPLPAGRVKEIHSRYGMPNNNGSYPWSRFYDRFDVAKEPNEAFRFGWVVEFDPYDPTFVPKKRTALGRFRHEGCTIQVAPDGRIAAYSGDDQVFQFAYKFVSDGRYNHFNRAANADLLDSGTLYAAKYNADGTGEWLPLVFGTGALTPANGYNSQADVLIDTRGAAARMGATPMDRPEDMEVNPVNGKVYLALTNNTARTDLQKDMANPRANNRWGHIIEMTEQNGDHAATRFEWEIFILCGDGNNPAHGTFFAGYDPKKVSALAAPDNISFDSKGNLWIATDGQPGILGGNDGIYAVPTDGAERGFVRQLVSAVPGSETASLAFNPDDTTLFVTIQHPGEGGRWTDNPSDLISRFPDGVGPNKPAIITISKASGNPVVGS
jgi:uncharacterized protein